jgi:tRNA wybutosine-synthesizing protein 3
VGFETEKNQAVNNLLVSNSVGDVDEELMPLLNRINALEKYYTTSSCAGRISLLEDFGGKGLDAVLVKWHRRVAAAEVEEIVRANEGRLWFRLECPIIHIMAWDVDCADKILHIARESGFKRSGIQSVKKYRVLVEVLSTERIEAPVFPGITGEYIKVLVDEANRKYDVGAQKIKRLKDAVDNL